MNRNVIFFQVGAFCESYHAGDNDTARILGFSPMRENSRGVKYGFPVIRVIHYLRRLLREKISVMLILESDRYRTRIKERLPAFRF